MEEKRAPVQSPVTRETDNFSFSLELDAPELVDCFLYHPLDDDRDPYPLDYELLQHAQFDDQELQLVAAQDHETYPVQQFNGIPLICYAQNDKPWRICIPDQHLNRVVDWYHRILGHSGITRVHDTIAVHFFHPHLRDRTEERISSCEHCQKHKLVGRGVGELPPREAPLLPWEEVAVDLVGPWPVEVNGRELLFHALTCIDPVTNLVELVRIQNKTAAYVGMKFENEWLARYPNPTKCIFDQGREFIGDGFQRVLRRNGIKPAATTVKNPQANAVCERMHQTVANMLRPLLRARPPQNHEQAADVVDSALATAARATRIALHRQLQISPGALVYQRDMLLNIPLLADIQTIRDRRQVLIDEQLRQENMRRRSHDYAVGERVLVVAYKPTKLGSRTMGPYTIERVHANGTVTIRRAPTVQERINIRRLRPYQL